jgi:hypothetical protein
MRVLGRKRNEVTIGGRTRRLDNEEISSSNPSPNIVVFHLNMGGCLNTPIGQLAIIVDLFSGMSCGLIQLRVFPDRSVFTAITELRAEENMWAYENGSN